MIGIEYPDEWLLIFGLYFVYVNIGNTIDFDGSMNFFVGEDDSDKEISLYCRDFTDC